MRRSAVRIRSLAPEKVQVIGVKSGGLFLFSELSFQTHASPRITPAMLPSPFPWFPHLGLRNSLAFAAIAKPWTSYHHSEDEPGCAHRPKNARDDAPGCGGKSATADEHGQKACSKRPAGLAWSTRGRAFCSEGRTRRENRIPASVESIAQRHHAAFQVPNTVAKETATPTTRTRTFSSAGRGASGRAP